jgi:hypothetical protein
LALEFPTAMPNTDCQMMKYGLIGAAPKPALELGVKSPIAVPRAPKKYHF